jgi:predicted AAA+ superfamily ATPase
LHSEFTAPFFTSYIQTYVERDLRLIDNVENLELFGRFLSLLAALTAKEIKYNELGREIGISHQTAKRWCSALLSLYQWRQVSPYYSNTIKRISESPKGYLTDTGVACHLLKIFSPTALAVHPLLGSLFETWVVGHIHQLFASCTAPPHAHHWRIHSGAEVDLILEWNGHFYPIEIKCSQNLSRADLYGFKAFRETHPHLKVMPNLLIHAGEDNYLMDKETLALSWKAL